TDRQRVFADIAASAARLCEAYDATIYQVDADVLHLVAHHGPIQVGPVGRFTLPLIRGLLNARAVLARQVIHLPAGRPEAARNPGVETMPQDLVSVPCSQSPSSGRAMQWA